MDKIVTFTDDCGEPHPAVVVESVNPAMRLANLVVFVDDTRATVWQRHVVYSDAQQPYTWRDY